jgi:hypothetical protein
MGKCRKALACAIFIATAAFPASAQLFEDQGVDMPSARTAAIGGVHVALADDFTVLFSNPAGFRAAGPEMSFAELTLGLSGPVFSMLGFVLQAMGGMDISTMLLDPDSAAAALFTNLYAAGTLNGPLAFGYVGNGLGFGFFNKTGVSFETVGTIPTITASLHEDIVFAGGYAFRIPLPEESRMTLDLGLLVKTFVVGKVEISNSILELMSVLSAPSLGAIIGQPFLLDVGAGLDVGIRYSWNNVLSVGVVGRNLPTFTMRNTYPSLTGFLAGATPVTGYGYVPIDLSAGIEFSPNLGLLNPYITNVKFLADYEDILDFLTHPATATNPILHAGIGVELALLEILFLRGGFYNGYFSAGLGLDLTIFKLDLAMFGTELSGEPGMRPVYNILLGLTFTF